MFLRTHKRLKSFLQRGQQQPSSAFDLPFWEMRSSISFAGGFAAASALRWSRYQAVRFAEIRSNHRSDHVMSVWDLLGRLGGGSLNTISSFPVAGESCGRSVSASNRHTHMPLTPYDQLREVCCLCPYSDTKNNTSGTPCCFAMC